MPLTGRVALVTEASNGIGRSIALAFADANAAVAVGYSHTQEQAEDVVKELAVRGAPPIACQITADNNDQYQEMIRQIETQLGEIDCLVLNSKNIIEKNFDTFSSSDWEKAFGPTLRTPFFICQSIVKKMKSRGYGRIIYVATTSSGEEPLHYSMANAGMINLIQSLSSHYSQYGITANIIASRTNDMPASSLSTPQKKGRNASFDDIAQAVVFLAREESTYITGPNDLRE